MTPASLVSLCALVGVLVLPGTLAQAAVTHQFLPEPSKALSKGVPVEGPKGEPIPAPGPFSGLNSMTVDSGGLYVAEGGETSRLDRFSASSGAFLAQFPQVPLLSFLHQGVAVGHSTGEPEVYVGGDESNEGPKGVVAAFDAAGSLQAVWKGPNPPSESFECFECSGTGDVAVDNSAASTWAAGDVYVADPRHAVVDVFKPNAGGGEKYEAQLKGPEPPGVLFGNPVSVAVSQSNGDVFVVDAEESSAGKTVDMFRPAAIAGSYEFLGQLTLPEGSFERVNHVSVDAGNGDIYVVESERGIVDQFNAAGVYQGALTGTPAGPFNHLSSVAVDPVSHDVYVGDNREPEASAIDVFGPGLVLPDVTTTAASEINVTSDGHIEATLSGTVNLDKEGEATCQFAYGTSVELGHAVPCPAPVTDESGPVAVHTQLSGLEPDTTYFYRLGATNKNGTNPGVPSQDQSFTTPGPGIHEVWSSDVSSTSATVNAKVDPHGQPTEVFFEYGPGTSYGSKAPLPPAAISSGAEGQVHAHLQSLTAATLYHYRAVAVSEAGEFHGADQTFTTQGAGGGPPVGGLPDHRRWELVSPPDKHGAKLEPINEEHLVQASSSGDAIGYLATVPTEASVSGYTLFEQVLSGRGPRGWSSQDISTAHASAVGSFAGSGTEYRFFSEDLSLALVEPQGEFTSLAPESSPPDSERTPYVRHDTTCAAAPAGCFQPLLTSAPGYADVPPGTDFGGEGESFGKTKFVGATPDLAHVILNSAVALTETPTTIKPLYEWSAGRPPSEQLQLVSVLPNGQPANTVTGLGEENRIARHAVSDDGSRVVWSERQGHLYLRVNATQPQSAISAGKCTEPSKACTLQLDLPEAGCEGNVGECGSGSVELSFQLASNDVSRVFFTDGQGLTKGSATQPKQPDLYECEVVEEEGQVKCKLSDLTPRSVENANVQGLVLGASEDGLYVYFVANGVLGDGAEHGAVSGNCNHGGGEGACNLYMWHDGVTSLVAVLPGDDFPDWSGESLALSTGGETSRVSPSGRWLAFMSDRSLSGYDTRDAVTGKPDEEVYLFDASRLPSSGGGGSVANPVCASCDPSGARPAGVEYKKLDGGLAGGHGVWVPQQSLAANIPAWTGYEGGIVRPALYQPRYLSDSGHLFFNSSDALVPQDINNNEDVYQYEPVAVSDCTISSPTYSQSAGGCISLISSGTAAGESAFLDASENGDDVFFLTAERLVPKDIDTAFDVYDAHVCSASVPCVDEAERPPACSTADSCRVAPEPQPGLFGAPASSTLSSPGNFAPFAPRPRVTLTRAQRLAKALSACRKKYTRRGRRRAVCDRQARKQYGLATGGKSKSTKRKR